MSIVCSFGLEVDQMFFSRVFLIIVYSAMALPTALVNLLILVTIWRTPSLHKPSQVLLANLAITDLLTAAIFCPVLAFSNVTIIKEWNSLFCNVWITAAPFVVCFGGVNLYTLAVIGIDRFLAIRAKFSYRTIVTTRRILYAVLTGWLLAVCSQGTFVILLYNSMPLRSYIIIAALFVAFLLCILTIFYSMAFYDLKKVSLQVSSSATNEPTAPNTPSNFDVTKYRRSLHTMVIVLSAVLFCYSPYSCFLMLKMMVPNKLALEHLVHFGQLLMIFRSVINPLLYLWRMEDLRLSAKTVAREFRMLLCL